MTFSGHDDSTINIVLGLLLLYHTIRLFPVCTSSEDSLATAAPGLASDNLSVLCSVVIPCLTQLASLKKATAQYLM